MEDHEDQYDQAVPGHGQASAIIHSQPPINQDEPVPYNPLPSLGLAPDMADAFMTRVRQTFLQILTTEQAFQLLADLNRDLNEALAREIEEQTSKVSEAQQKLDRLSGLKYNLINR